MKRSALAGALLASLILGSATPASAFVRGDVDGGGVVNIADAISILTTLFQPGAPPAPCPDAADANDDGVLNIADAISLLAWLFQPGSTQPPPPFPNDGIDPTADTLPPCGPVGLLPFTTIAQGSDSGFMTSIQSVITSPTDWSAFWTQHSADPLPTVNFTSDMVIVILGFFSNLGVSYTVNELEVVGSTLEVRYTVVYPGVYYPQSTQPHHIVKTTRTLATPVFLETIIALP